MEKGDEPADSLLVDRRSIHCFEKEARRVEGVVDVERKAEAAVRAVAEGEDGASEEQRLEAGRRVDRGHGDAARQDRVGMDRRLQQPNLGFLPQQGAQPRNRQCTDLEGMLLDRKFVPVRKRRGDVPDERELVLPLRRANRDLCVKSGVDGVEHKWSIAELLVHTAEECAAGSLLRVTTGEAKRVKARGAGLPPEVPCKQEAAEPRDLRRLEGEVAGYGELHPARADVCKELIRVGTFVLARF